MQHDPTAVSSLSQPISLRLQPLTMATVIERNGSYIPSYSSGNGEDDEEFFTRIQASTTAYLVDSNVAIEEIQSERNALRETRRYLHGLIQAQKAAEAAAERNELRKTARRMMFWQWYGVMCRTLRWAVVVSVVMVATRGLGIAVNWAVREVEEWWKEFVGIS